MFKLASADEKLTPLTEGEGNFGPFARNRSGTQMVLLHETPERPLELWLRSDGKEPMRQVSKLNPELEGLSLGRMETVRWKSADGIEIEGLVVYPTDYQEGRRYPTVLDIHGGPESAHTRGYTANWSSDPQVYAAAGYVTFLPNFRSVRELRRALRPWCGLQFRGARGRSLPGPDDRTRLAWWRAASRIPSVWP